jgi:hypothetical protein
LSAAHRVVVIDGGWLGLELRQAMKQVAAKRRLFGYRRVHVMVE